MIPRSASLTEPPQLAPLAVAIETPRTVIAPPTLTPVAVAPSSPSLPLLPVRSALGPSTTSPSADLSPDEAASEAPTKQPSLDLASCVPAAIQLVVLFVLLFGAEIVVEPPAAGQADPGAAVPFLLLFVMAGCGLVLGEPRRLTHAGLAHAAYALGLGCQWALVIQGALRCLYEDRARLHVSLAGLCDALVAVISALIGLGALVGVLSPLQLAVYLPAHVLFHAVNLYVSVWVLGAEDAGRTVTCFLFGAVFGLAAAACLAAIAPVAGASHTHAAASYSSQHSAALGAALCLVSFPVLNALHARTAAAHVRALVHCALAIAAAITAAFWCERVARTKPSLSSLRIGVFGGGIAIGACGVLKLQVGLAVLCGACAGAAGIAARLWLMPRLRHTGPLLDAGEALAASALPGLIGAGASILAYGTAQRSAYGVAEYDALLPFGSTQGRRQAAATAATLGIAAVGGALVGLALRACPRARRRLHDAEHLTLAPALALALADATPAVLASAPRRVAGAAVGAAAGAGAPVSDGDARLSPARARRRVPDGH